MKVSFKTRITPQDRIDDTYLINKVIEHRQIPDIKAFLHPPHPFSISLGDFGFKNETKQTLELLEQLLKNHRPVVVYTDYDADGITGGAILLETLGHLGFNVKPYVPHRMHEGYGFSVKGLDNVKKEFNPALIISVDHGIAAPEQIAYAVEHGMKVIVTDHHIKQEKIPEKAEAIFHIPALSGSGVAYFFAKMVYEHFKDSPDVIKNNLAELEEHFHNDYIGLASIGTVADLVPLVGPSRSIVKFGLIACSRTKRIGLCEILKQAGISGRTITPYEIGFIIAPRINAIGRLKHAIDALHLLVTVNYEQAFKLAGDVGKLNVERQDMVKKAVAEAYEDVATMQPLPKIIILQSDIWHEGIIGLIASRIAEKYYRPTVVMTKSDGFYKGSARSIPSFHITNALVATREHLMNVGGHVQAAGFSVEADKIDKFKEYLIRIADEKISDKDLERSMEVDFDIPLEKATVTLAKKLEELEPYGIGNPAASFYSRGKILDIRPFGKNKEHLRIYVVGPVQKWFPLELVAFNGLEKWPTIVPGQEVEITYQLEIDRWGGSEKLRARPLYIQTV